MSLEITPGSIVSSGHVVLTGPINGTVTLHDGTVVNVSPLVVEAADQAQADEIAHEVGLRYAAEGHPNLIETDATGAVVQRPFEYVTPSQ